MILSHPALFIPILPPSPSELVFIETVDLTDYPIFRHPEVLRAVEFARDAHRGQVGKYLLEALLSC